MASIIKRKSKYSVVYYYNDTSGSKKQRWESFDSHKEALARKAEVEHKMNEGTFIPPQEQNVRTFLADFVSLYGEKKWSATTYEGNLALIRNYVNPIIGEESLESVNPRFVDKFIKKLETTRPLDTRFRKARSEHLSPRTVEKIHKLMSCAFRQAVRWELLARNPFENAVVAKVPTVRRDIWTADMIRNALDSCKDSKLYVAINLAFACSLRVGEILGLTWDKVHIDDENIVSDNAYVLIDKELKRLSKNAIEAVGDKEILFSFPAVLSSNASTRLVLKTPKTESSIRKVWLPKTLAYILRDWKAAQNELKEYLGDEYQDFNLVIAHQNGRPCEQRSLNKEFALLKKEAELPNVVFHSLRHSSTTYKLKLNHGDLKATQGDTGHAQIDMITDVYSHILDEDRKVNAQKFEAAFYSTSAQENENPPENGNSTIDVQALVAELQNNPELAATLSNLLSAQAS